MLHSVVRDAAEELQIILSLLTWQVGLEAAFLWLWAHGTAAPMSSLGACEDRQERGAS